MLRLDYKWKERGVSMRISDGKNKQNDNMDYVIRICSWIE